MAEEFFSKLGPFLTTLSGPAAWNLREVQRTRNKHQTLSPHNQTQTLRVIIIFNRYIFPSSITGTYTLLYPHTWPITIIHTLHPINHSLRESQAFSKPAQPTLTQSRLSTDDHSSSSTICSQSHSTFYLRLYMRENIYVHHRCIYHMSSRNFRSRIN